MILFWKGFVEAQYFLEVERDRKTETFTGSPGARCSEDTFPILKECCWVSDLSFIYSKQ